MSRLTDEEILSMLAPFVTRADIKARNARVDSTSGKSRVRHMFHHEDTLLALEMGMQSRSMCGKVWGWPALAMVTQTAVRQNPGNRCKLCLRIFGAT